MNIKTFNWNKNYKFIIKYKPTNNLGMCKYPKETISVTYRPPSRLYYNYKSEVVKKIVYPQDLWYEAVFSNDPFENAIIQIKNYLPDWTSIEILKRN
jgi:hypothetical protein